uniref:39S ribosomal protein L1, mitochondrial n=1 Tax=Lepeophtheirus salmonis TaxID=72036 RepID=D3PHH3_LEPSM|nr:39S ribosomal protein L1, mitochondrial [Lepeophtheirus salmonis]
MSISQRLLGSSCAFLFEKRTIHLGSSLEAARRMTRDRKRKIALANKKKKEDRLRRNPPPLPYKLELMLKSKGLWDNRHLRDKDENPVPVDDVFSLQIFTWPRYSIKEAIEKLRDFYDPTMFDNPNALVKAKIEFRMIGSKVTRFIEGFDRMVPIYHKYDEEIPSKTVCIFVPDEESKQIAVDAGASLAGGEDLIMDISKGRVDVSDIEYFLAHEDMVLSLKPLTGQLRDKVPRKQEGTLGNNIEYMVKTFTNGQKISIKKVPPSLLVEDEPDYGYCIVEFGRLQMDIEKLEDNINGILLALSEKNVMTRVSKKDFITRCMLHVDDNFPSKISIVHDLILDKKGQKFMERQLVV